MSFNTYDFGLFSGASGTAPVSGRFQSGNEVTIGYVHRVDWDSRLNTAAANTTPNTWSLAMSLGLETDVGNPNFAGARNPDDLLWVQFSMKAMPNNFLSRPENQGRPIFQDEVWIEIRVPGNQLLTIERPKEHSDEFRFPRQWAFFQQTKGADGQEVGTPLTQWSLLTPARIQELRAQRFYTVEQIAFASDDQLKSLGMGPGMAPTAFR